MALLKSRSVVLRTGTQEQSPRHISIRSIAHARQTGAVRSNTPYFGLCLVRPADAAHVPRLKAAEGAGRPAEVERDQDEEAVHLLGDAYDVHVALEVPFSRLAAWDGGRRTRTRRMRGFAGPDHRGPSAVPGSRVWCAPRSTFDVHWSDPPRHILTTSPIIARSASVNAAHEPPFSSSRALTSK